MPGNKPETWETLKSLKERIVCRIDVSREVSDREVFEIIDEALWEQSRKAYLSIDERLKLRKDIFNSIRRLDVLQDLLEDERVTEIMVNGCDKIFFEKDGRLFLSERQFESSQKLEDIIQKIAADVNRTVNEAHPMVDARLEDGSRVNIVLPPVALNGASVTIRKFSKGVMSLEQLIDLDSVSREAAEFLRLLVRGRYNIICSGGTGCGKTTLLNALAGCISTDDRVVTIEDSAELIMEGLTNIVRLEARGANVEGKNEITLRSLVRNSLRMRPDRIVIGEVRGGEAIDMLQGLNTGHCGMSTGHANSPRDMLMRLETMVLLSENIPLHAVRAQIASAIDVIIGISRMRDGSRKIVEICEVDGMKNGEIKLNRIFGFQEINEGQADECGSRKIVKGRLVKVGELKHREKLRMYGLE